SLAASLSHRRVRRAALAVFACAVAVAAASCTQDSRALARVGKKTITVAQFEEVARTAREQYPWLPDSAKRVLLDDLIRRELMLQEAEARGVTQDTLLRDIRRTAEENLMVN